MADFIPGTNPFSAGDDFPSTDPAVTLPGAVPDGIICDYPHRAQVSFGTSISTSYSGKEKRATKVPRQFRFTLRFEQLLPSDADILWQHYIAQVGALTGFSYYDYLSGELFTVRYAMEAMSRESFIFDAEKVGVELVEVL